MISEFHIKGQAPYFTRGMLKSLRGLLYSVSGCLLLSWWVSSFLDYISLDGLALVFPAVFMFALVYVSYFHLSRGRAEYSDQPAHQKAHATHFLRLLTGVFFHILFVQLLLLPVLTVSAAVSGLSIALLGAGIAVIALSSLVAELIGLSCLQLGRDSISGLVCSRFLFIGHCFLSGWILPVLNPIYILFQIHKVQGVGSSVFPEIRIHLVAVSLAALLLILLCWFLNSRKKF